MTDKTYTVAELTALPDSELTAMAAELRGWTLSSTKLFWRDSSGEVVCHRGSFTPITDRNQSGELLIEMARQGASFTIDFDLARPMMGVEWRIPTTICSTNCDDPNNAYQCGGYCNCDCHKRPCGTISGSDAHAETVAAIAAWLALKGRLK